MGQLLLLQRGRVRLIKERNKQYEDPGEERKVKIKKPKVPKESAEQYMAYMSMQGGSRFGL